MSAEPQTPQPDWSGVYAELGITEPPYDASPADERPDAPAMVRR